MKDRVVCITNCWKLLKGPDAPNPIKGEIYTVIAVETHGSMRAYSLLEFGEENGYDVRGFRNCDLSYGPLICETIEEIHELEKVITV